MADSRTAAQGGKPRPQSFGDAFREARLAGDKTFEFKGQTYSTKTAEEQGREIGAKAAAGSGRGASAGREASDRDTARGRAEIPTGGAEKAPASTGEGGMSDTTRNVLNTLGALGAGAGAGLGARALMRREAAKRAADAERLASRVDPMLSASRTAETGKFRPSEASLSEARRQAREEMTAEPQFKRGGKVKTYASGGSVRGAGIAQRGVRKCKVC